jgi:glucose/arabinose dehydrogenase
VFAEGVGVPSALAWTADAKLWLADSTDRGARLWRIGGEKYGLPGGVVPGGIAFQADGAGNTLLLARVDGGGISRFRMQLGSDAVHAATPLVGASFGRVRCVLPMGDSVYFCTDNAQDTGLADDRILRVPAS